MQCALCSNKIYSTYIIASTLQYFFSLFRLLSSNSSDENVVQDCDSGIDANTNMENTNGISNDEHVRNCTFAHIVDTSIDNEFIRTNG